MSTKFTFPAGASRGQSVSLSQDNQALIIKGKLDGRGAKDLFAEAITRHNAERAEKGLPAQEAPESYSKHAASLMYGLMQRFAQRLGKGDAETKAAAEKVGLPAVVQAE
jgi:hypothetical protein